MQADGRKVRSQNRKLANKSIKTEAEYGNNGLAGFAEGAFCKSLQANCSRIIPAAENEKPPAMSCWRLKNGAPRLTRTDDLPLTRRLLYQLSY
jgi:hypothetical protein